VLNAMTVKQKIQLVCYHNLKFESSWAEHETRKTWYSTNNLFLCSFCWK